MLETLYATSAMAIVMSAISSVDRRPENRKKKEKEKEEKKKIWNGNTMQSISSFLNKIGHG
jgi:hypothetical protein